MYRQFNELQNHYRQQVQQKWLKHYEEENAQKMKLKSLPLLPTTKLDATLQHLTKSLDDLESVISSFIPNESIHEREDRIKREFKKKYSKLRDDYNKAIRSGTVSKTETTLEDLINRRLKLKIYLNGSPEIEAETNEIARDARDILEDPNTTAQERQLVLSTLRDLKMDNIALNTNWTIKTLEDLQKLKQSIAQQYGAFENAPKQIQDKYNTIVDESLSPAYKLFLTSIQQYGNPQAIPQGVLDQIKYMLEVSQWDPEQQFNTKYIQTIPDLAETVAEVERIRNLRQQQLLLKDINRTMKSNGKPRPSVNEGDGDESYLQPTTVLPSTTEYEPYISPTRQLQHSPGAETEAAARASPDVGNFADVQESEGKRRWVENRKKDFRTLQNHINEMIGFIGQERIDNLQRRKDVLETTILEDMVMLPSNNPLLQKAVRDLDKLKKDIFNSDFEATEIKNEQRIARDREKRAQKAEETRRILEAKKQQQPTQEDDEDVSPQGQPPKKPSGKKAASALDTDPIHDKPKPKDKQSKAAAAKGSGRLPPGIRRI